MFPCGTTVMLCDDRVCEDLGFQFRSNQMKFSGKINLNIKHNSNLNLVGLVYLLTVNGAACIFFFLINDFY